MINLIDLSQELEVFADGGVIKKNPSPYGGTWAFRFVQGGSVLLEDWGAFRAENEFSKVTNNVTELVAIVKALGSIPSEVRFAKVFSDSANALGRVFQNWSKKNVPFWLLADLRRERLRLRHFRAFAPVQLDGHPTRAQLAAGVGKRGNRVSEHNVWCDRACTLAGKELFARLQEEEGTA